MVTHLAIGPYIKSLGVVDRMLVVTLHDGTFPMRIPFEHVYGIYDDGRAE